MTAGSWLRRCLIGVGAGLSAVLLVGCALASQIEMVEERGLSVPIDIHEQRPLGREVWLAQTVEELVVNALVVEARVTAIAEVGEVVVDDARWPIIHATLAVTDVLHGQAPDRMVIEDDGRLSTASNLGDHGIYFLVQRRDRPDGIVRLITSQGRYRLDASGDLHPSNIEDELATELGGLSLLELKEAVRDAVGEIERAGITPRPLPTLTDGGQS